MDAFSAGFALGVAFVLGAGGAVTAVCVWAALTEPSDVDEEEG